MNDVKPLRRSTGCEHDGAAEMLRERLIFLAEDFATSDGKFKYLERRTGIPAASWEDLFLRRIPADTDMILALAKHRRDKIEWLLTGHVSKMIRQKRPNGVSWEEFEDQRTESPRVC